MRPAHTDLGAPFMLVSPAEKNSVVRSMHTEFIKSLTFGTENELWNSDSARIFYDCAATSVCEVLDVTGLNDLASITTPQAKLCTLVRRAWATNRLTNVPWTPQANSHPHTTPFY
eukprot:g37802.t1